MCAFFCFSIIPSQSQSLSKYFSLSFSRFISKSLSFISSHFMEHSFIHSPNRLWAEPSCVNVVDYDRSCCCYRHSHSHIHHSSLCNTIVYALSRACKVFVFICWVQFNSICVWVHAFRRDTQHTHALTCTNAHESGRTRARGSVFTHTHTTTNRNMHAQYWLILVFLCICIERLKMTFVGVYWN